MNPDSTDRYDETDTTSSYRASPVVVPTYTEDTDVKSIDHSPVVATSQSLARVTSPGLIVLQWLTYAFWGWAILALLFLVGIAASYSFQPNLLDTTTEQPVAYGIAAVLVLLPIAVICDVFYSRREETHKRGAAMVIMVVHTVVFALLGIASLIAIAFSVVSLILGSGDTTGPITAIIVAALAVVLYVLTLVRTVRPFGFGSYRLLFRSLMLAVALAVATWGILGPVAQAARTKDDRSVSSAMQVIYDKINSYVAGKSTLPPSLEAALDSDAGSGTVNRSTINDLVRRQLITYTRDTAPAKSFSIGQPDGLGDTTLYYTLCATYRYDHTSAYDSGESMVGAEGYSDYYNPYARTHAGKNCYKLKTSAVYSSFGVEADTAGTQKAILQ